MPGTLAELVTLPGVGRKTANVVLGNGFGVPGITVDTHFGRLVRRFGWTTETDPVKVEAQLCEVLPPERWTRASDALILHGRRICKPKPLCQRCHVRPDCDFYRTGVLTKPVNRKVAARVITARSSRAQEPKTARPRLSAKKRARR